MSSNDRVCSDCNTPVDDRGCPNCWWKTPVPRIIKRTHWTLAQGAGFSPPPPGVLARRALGTATGTSAGATLAGVQLLAGDFLVVGVAEHQPDQQGAPAVTWHGATVPELPNWEKQHGECDTRIFGLRISGDAIGPIVVTDTTSPVVDGFAFWASAWRGLSSSPVDARTSSLGHPGSEYLYQLDFNSTMGIGVQAREVLIVNEVTFRTTTGGNNVLGTFDADTTAGQQAADTVLSSGAGDFTGVRIREGYRILSSAGAIVTSVTRTAGQGSEWILMGGTLKIDPTTIVP